jgi:hypothetical protein
MNQAKNRARITILQSWIFRPFFCPVTHYSRYDRCANLPEARPDMFLNLKKLFYVNNCMNPARPRVGA